MVGALAAAERAGGPGSGIRHSHLLTHHLNRAEAAAEHEHDGRNHQGEFGGDATRLLRSETAWFTACVTARPFAATESTTPR
ncbi:hypothetical protein GCM10022381_17980 [Leifsonia kafniensis]|uniref:Uncharacterized protein n=1 Tax=Leifsonia kafniensis TaxID=475957 RepID=A0ABP7KFV8_9MICO